MRNNYIRVKLSFFLSSSFPLPSPAGCNLDVNLLNEKKIWKKKENPFLVSLFLCFKLIPSPISSYFFLPPIPQKDSQHLKRERFFVFTPFLITQKPKMRLGRDTKINSHHPFLSFQVSFSLFFPFQGCGPKGTDDLCFNTQREIFPSSPSPSSNRSIKSYMISYGLNHRSSVP